MRLALPARLALAAGVILGTAGHAAWAQAYRIDPTHTTLHWEVVHMGTSTARGRFDRLGGEVSFEPGRLLRADITVQTESVSTGIPVFDRVLRSGNLLQVETHPQARFVGESVRWAPDGLSPAELTGSLTLRGITAPVTLRAQRWRCANNPLFGREVCGGDFSAELSRSAYGMGYVASMADDRVALRIQIEAVRLDAAEVTGAGTR